MDEKHDLADLPPGWELKRLGDICALRKAIVSPQADDYLPYVGLEHVDSGETRISRWGLSSEVKSAKTEFQPGDILYGKLRPYLDKAVLAPWKGVCTTELIALQAVQGVAVPEFLVCLLHTKPVIRHAINTTGGTNLPRTSWSAMQEFALALPPLPEQQAIAHVLRAVQRAKEATERVVAAARQLKQSLLRHLFTYGPTPFDQADRVALKETDFGPVPEAWSVRPLNECARVQTGVAKGRKIENGEAVELPYLRVANVQDGYLDLAEMKNITIRRSEIIRFSLQAGDVVLTEGGDFDKLGRGFIWHGQIAGCVHQNHIFAVRANREMVKPEFLAFLTQSSYGKSYFLTVAHKTTNLACINTTKLKALPTLLPPLKDQEKIVSALSVADRKIEVETASLRSQDALFQTLLHNLITGKVRVAAAGGGP